MPWWPSYFSHPSLMLTPGLNSSHSSARTVLLSGLLATLAAMFWERRQILGILSWLTSCHLMAGLQHRVSWIRTSCAKTVRERQSKQMGVHGCRQPLEVWLRSDIRRMATSRSQKTNPGNRLIEEAFPSMERLSPPRRTRFWLFINSGTQQVLEGINGESF